MMMLELCLGKCKCIYLPSHLCFSDFGLSKMLYNDSAMLQTACGTPGYVGK